jgi:hypothetical protein
MYVIVVYDINEIITLGLKLYFVEADVAIFVVLRLEQVVVAYANSSCATCTNGCNLLLSLC